MCTNTSTSCQMEIHQAVAYTPVFLVGLLVNAAALWAIIAKRNTWTDTHIYMLNLAIADSALVLFLPFRIYDAVFCLSKTTLCTFLIFIHFINMYASILTSTAISFNRYLAVRFPLQYRSWRRKKEMAFAVCLAIWVVVLTSCFVYHEVNYPHKLWVCFERCEDCQLPFEFVMTVVALGFLAPLLITVFCSGRIICVLSLQDDESGEKKSIVGIVTANMIVFIICYTPMHVGFLVSYFHMPPAGFQSTYKLAHGFFLSSEWIASTNCCFDSIGYYFLLKVFYS